MEAISVYALMEWRIKLVDTAIEWKLDGTFVTGAISCRFVTEVCKFGDKSNQRKYDLLMIGS